MDLENIEFRLLSLTKKVYFNKISPMVILITVVLGVVLAGSGFLFYQYQQAQKELKTLKSSNDQSQPIQTDAKKIIESVSKLIRLPKGEDPAVASITDIDKLKDQPVFQNAKNGDKILLFANAHKVIIYDPKANIVDDVVTISSANTVSSSPAVAGASNQQLPKIAIKNGTTAQGLASKLESDIKKSSPDANIISKNNAAKMDYNKSLIVVFNQSFKDYASNLAKTLNLTSSDLPPNESKPQGADMLIIAGGDKI